MMLFPGWRVAELGQELPRAAGHEWSIERMAQWTGHNCCKAAICISAVGFLAF